MSSRAINGKARRRIDWIMRSGGRVDMACRGLPFDVPKDVILCVDGVEITDPAEKMTRLASLFSRIPLTDEDASE